MTAKLLASADQGANALRNILFDAIQTAKKELGYKPLVIWSSMQEHDKPDQDKLWLMAVDNVSRDRHAGIGRRRYKVEGTFVIAIHIPRTSATLPVKAWKLAETIKTAYRNQDIIPQWILYDAIASEGEPVEAWNKIDMGIVYQYQYFIK